MKKSVIGITLFHNTDNDGISVHPTHPRAIEAVDGLPILLPLGVPGEDLKQLSGLCDDSFFFDGPDIHPLLLREETHTQHSNVSMARDIMELSLLKLAADVQRPVLRICRGTQIINVGLGDDIYQDISSQTEIIPLIAYKQPYSCCLSSHHMDMRRDMLLYTIAEGKTEIVVNSPHYQAACRIAPCLMASGHMPDGIIEAPEAPDYPYLLVLQWHPEYIRQIDTVSANISRSFVDACQR